MPTRGIKRKYSEWEGSVLDEDFSFQADSYFFFRQSLLNISLEKFNKGRSMAEPSLRRYVLISNTLRVIQNEIHHESPCPLPAEYDGLPGSCDPLAGNVVGSLLPPDLENLFLTPIEDDFTLSAAVSSILKELEGVLDGSGPQSLQRPFATTDPEAKVESLHQEGSEILTTPQLSSPCVEATKEEVFNSSSDSLGDRRDIELMRELALAEACSENLPAPVQEALPEFPVAMDTSIVAPVPVEVSLRPSNGESPVDMNTSRSERMESEVLTDNSASSVPAENVKTSESVFGSFEIMNSSYLRDVSLDDLFSDIDTSVFEREFISVVPSSTRFSASDELWFPSSCNSSSYNSNQGVREPNDLDNIVEILVGS